jgi:hypothetical protein
MFINHTGITMRKLAFITTLLLACATFALDLVIPGENVPRVSFPPKQVGSQTCTEVTIEGKKALRIDWDPTKAPWSEFWFSPQCKLPQFYQGTIAVELWLPSDIKNRYPTIRVTDSVDEAIQLEPTNKTIKPGWQTLTYEIDTTKKVAHSWARGGYKSDDLNKIYDQPLKLGGMAFGFKDTKEKGHLAVGNFTFKLLRAPLDINVETNCPVHVLKPEDVDKLAFTVATADADTHDITGTLILTDSYKNQILKTEFATTVAPGKTWRLPLPRPEKFGVYYLDATIQHGDKTQNRKMSYCHMIPAGPTPGKSKGFIFGVQQHTERYPLEEQKKEAIAAGLMGAKVYRCGAMWWASQREKDDVPDFSRVEAIFKLYEEQGLEPQVLFGNHYGNWARDPNWKPFTTIERWTRSHNFAPNIQEYAKYVNRFMTHFKGRVRFIESWNEPDLLGFANFPMETYNEIQKEYYKAAKAADPNVIALTGGYTAFRLPCPESSPHPEYFTQSLVDTKGHYDVVAFHAHGQVSGYAPQVDKMNAAFKELDIDKPWWSNETAVSSVNIGETAQAETLFRKLFYCWANGGIGYNWYVNRNKGFNPKDSEHHYGMHTMDFYPKQVYATYNMIARHFKEAQFVKDYKLNNDFRTYLYKAKNGDWLIPTFIITGRKTLPVLLGNITGEASVIDIFDNETPLNTNQQIALITLDNRSKTIRVKNQAEQPTMNVDIVNIPAFCLIKPNEDNFLNIGIANPTTNSLDVTVAFKQPNQVNLDWTKQTFSLKPNERSTAKLKLTPKSNEIFKTTDNFTLDCTIQINQAVAQTAQILCRPVTIVTKDTPAVFILDKHEQITSTVVNEPNTRHLFWKGKDDLSAVLTISKAGNDILLKAVVKDDIHNSTEKDDAIWKGDSIQVAILPHNNNIAPWVFGFALDNDNSTKSWVWFPTDDKLGQSLKNALKPTIQRDEAAKTTTYSCILPTDALKVNPEQGFSFNFMLNDADESTRESMMIFTPGLGSGPALNTETYPVIVTQ